MSIRTIITRGFGTGSFLGRIAEVVTRGYIFIRRAFLGDVHINRRRRTGRPGWY